MRMRENVEIVLATNERTHDRGAFNFSGANTLYGRYWGATENTRFCISTSAITTRSNSASSARSALRTARWRAQANARLFPTLTYSVHHLVDSRLRGGERVLGASATTCSAW